jgi:hypothetical protein
MTDDRTWGAVGTTPSGVAAPIARATGAAGAGDR